jgi:hypothetical protein
VHCGGQSAAAIPGIKQRLGKPSNATSTSHRSMPRVRDIAASSGMDIAVGRSAIAAMSYAIVI